MLCLFALSASVLHADTQSKIAYLKVEFPSTDTSLYVGQDIAVKYSLTLLSQAKLVGVDFVDLGAKNNVELINKSASWEQSSEGALQNTYIYRIKGKDVTLPPLRVKVASGDYEEEVLASGAKFQAVELDKRPNYANVIVDSLEIVEYHAEALDEGNNVIMFKLKSKGGTLSNMKIGQYAKQGLEDSKVANGVTTGIYYVVLDKSIRSLSFDYFSLSKKQFESITLPINVVRNVVDDGDIKPRNTFLIFKNLILGGLIIFVVLVWFVFKRIRKISLAVLVLLVVTLVYSLFFSATSGVAQAGAQISIIPTYKSTIMGEVSTPTKVDIIGEYGEYYKVVIDSKVGWIRKEYVSKN